MRKSLRTTLLLYLSLLSANAAMANDAVVGALLGGGAGVLVGRSLGGRDGAVIGGALGAAAGAAIASDNNHARIERVDYYPAPPAPVYYAQPTYYPPQQVYYTQPVRVEQRPVVYVREGYYWERHHDHHRRDWDRHDRGWGDHR